MCELKSRAQFIEMMFFHHKRKLWQINDLRGKVFGFVFYDPRLYSSYRPVCYFRLKKMK